MLLPITGVAALIVYILHGFDGILERDLAIYSYAGQQVVEGSPPYVGILNRAGPLAHLIPAVGVAAARVGGFEDILGIRWVYMLIAVACVCVVYVLARDVFASRLAGVVAATAFLTFHGFIRYATYGPREKTPMVLFLLLSLWAVARKRWFAVGIGIALATLVWQPVFLIGMAAVLTALVALRSPERIPALLRVVAGGLVPVLACVVYFAAAGALKEFVDGFLLINARYTGAAPLLTRFAKKWASMGGGYGVSLWVMGVGLVALAILAVLEVRRLRRKAPGRIPVVAFGVASLAAVAWSFRDFNFWPDAFVFLPLAAMGIGGIAAELTGRLPARIALSLGLAWVVAGVAIAVTYSTTRRNHELETQRASVTELLEQLPSDATILSIGAPEPLVISRKTNPTRHQTFTRGLSRYVNDTWPGGLRGFGEWVGRVQPTVISLDKNRIPRFLRETINREYRRAGRAPTWVWYVHRSVELLPDAAR